MNTLDARAAVVASLMMMLCACSKSACEATPSPRAQPTAPAESSQERPVRVMAVGDILLGDAAQDDLDQRGYDFPFEHLHPSVAGHDLLVGNLEGPITDHDMPVHARKKWVYRQRNEAAAALAGFGFDLLCLANNHALDYGEQGLLDTLAALDEAGIGYFGAGRNGAEAAQARVVEVAGVRIGFVGFYRHVRSYDELYDFYADEASAGVAPLREEVVRAAFEDVRRRADVLVASFHWGKNYAGVNRHQRRWARRAVELGADVVIGHHPHVVQGVEVYRGVPIVYSLGNFTFGTPGRFRKVDFALHHGWIADITIDHKKVRRVDLIPIRTNNAIVGFQPKVSSPDTLPWILETVNEPFGTDLEIVDGRVRLELF